MKNSADKVKTEEDLKLDQALYERLCETQRLISKKVVVSEEYCEGVEKVAGVDASYCGDSALVGFTVFSIPENRILLVSVSTTRSKMPYFSSLLCFREGPVVLPILRRFLTEYDVLLVNGHGLAHPRKCGLATFLGVLLKKPTIGVARKPLGRLDEEHNVNHLRAFGDRFYYSVGNMMTLEGAFNVLRRTTLRDRGLPIPLEAAHFFSRKALTLVAGDETV
ncbi:MAG: endonuclease V [Thermoproteota archaeon]